jgi:hypothetical protein
VWNIRRPSFEYTYIVWGYTGLGIKAVIKYQFGNEPQYPDFSEIDNLCGWFGF